STLMA
ncbi:hypothetical protein D046_3172, partial [Vibrio parahaemolyticus V-223/04]